MNVSFGDGDERIAVTDADDAAGNLTLQEFLKLFDKGLLDSLRKGAPPVYSGGDWHMDAIGELKRKPYHVQHTSAAAITELLLDKGEEGAILFGEMGCGKTMMAITTAHLFAKRGHGRFLVVCPPHLVYKWRREIIDTMPDVETLVLNGSDTIRRLQKLRDAWRDGSLPKKPLVVIIGRVRMRLGFYWRPAVSPQLVTDHPKLGELGKVTVGNNGNKVFCCPGCHKPVKTKGDEGLMLYVTFDHFEKSRRKCEHCGCSLWEHMRRTSTTSLEDRLARKLTDLPTIGKKTAARLMEQFGSEALAGWMDENPYDLVNIADEDGNFFFSDRQAQRIERYLGNTEFSLTGGGDYQPSEFVKRYLPQDFFDLLIVDEAHEMKGGASAQGQAFGTLASSCRKKLLLTGTLMGGYASDLFYLLWRLSPRRMVEDGYYYRPGRKDGTGGGLGASEMAFMRAHGVLKDVYVSKSDSDASFRTAKGSSKVTHHVSKAPGFSPGGLMRYIVPVTSFVRMTDIDSGVLPSYDERYVPVEMTDRQEEVYREMVADLGRELKTALAKGDMTLMGMVLQTSLAWPDCCFREEVCKHPRTKEVLYYAPPMFGDTEPTPKEEAMIDHIKREKKRGRRVLLYTVYSGTRDTTMRWKNLMKLEGLKASVLRASVAAEKREDWVMQEVESGIDVLICNPDLVKTGLDLLDFPTLLFANTGYSVFTLQQASRRSWRIGQKDPVEVHFYGYADTAQQSCLDLMAQKISVAQSTSGEMPDTGLDVLNTSTESVEVALAREILRSSGGGGKRRR